MYVCLSVCLSVTLVTPPPCHLSCSVAGCTAGGVRGAQTIHTSHACRGFGDNPSQQVVVLRNTEEEDR